MWILMGLLAAMSIALIWRDSNSDVGPSWTLCKEALIVQVFTNKCTPRLTKE